MEELKVGQSFEVWQNEYGSVTGIHNIRYDISNALDFRSVHGNVYYFGDICKRVAKLTITKLK